MRKVEAVVVGKGTWRPDGGQGRGGPVPKFELDPFGRALLSTALGEAGFQPGDTVCIIPLAEFVRVEGRG